MTKKNSLYELIEKQCNLEQIRDVLREYKDISSKTKKEIVIGGNKPDVIANLRRNVTLGNIPAIVPINLLRECEESGQQHIFFFRPRRTRDKSKFRDYDSLRSALQLPDVRYPLFEYVKERFHWVDFRRDIGGKPRDWVFKIYGHEIHFEQTRVERPTSRSRIEYYEAEETRVVCVVRWNDPDLLEIRIDSQRLNSMRSRNDRLSQVWDLMSPAIDKDEFVPWDMTNARTYMVKNRRGHPDFDLGDLCVKDADSGTAYFKTQTEEESIDELQERSRAIDELMPTGRCQLVLSEWKVPNEKHDQPPYRIRTHCGGPNENEVAIRARTTSRALNHVIDKLREFNRKAT